MKEFDEISLELDLDFQASALEQLGEESKPSSPVPPPLPQDEEIGFDLDFEDQDSSQPLPPIPEIPEVPEVPEISETLDVIDEVSDFPAPTEFTELPDITQEITPQVIPPTTPPTTPPVNTVPISSPMTVNDLEATSLKSIYNGLNNLKAENQELNTKLKNLRTELLATKQLAQQFQMEKEEKALELAIIQKKFHEDMEKMKTSVHVLEVKNTTLKSDLKIVTDERNLWQNKANIDIHAITRKEKELLNQLEMLKEDAQGQIDHRDKKIVELRSLLESIEFERQSMINFNQDEKKLRLLVQNKFDQLKMDLKKLVMTLDHE